MLVMMREITSRLYFQLKDLRNVVASGGHQMDDFPALLRTVEAPVLSCIQDLRSQVVREACITVA